MKIRERKNTIVEPSSRDSINAWLDVLTSMLALPEQQRAQVRDELEDHLRSRVDDLLITGLDEPDAIQRAVSELGETAELAKVVTNAHTQPTQRRRIMQSVLITAAIAGMSIGGFSLLTTTASVPTPQSNAAVVAIEEQERPDPSDLKEFNLDNLMFVDALEQVADSFGLTLDTSRTPSLVRDTSFNAVHLKGKYNLELAIGNLERYHAMQHDYRLLVDGDRLLTITTQEYARYNARTVVYPIDWATGETTSEIFHAVEGILEGNDGVTQIQKVSASLVVFAVPEVQDEARSIIEQLRSTFEISEYQRIQNAKIAQKKRIDEIQRKLLDVKNKLQAMEFEISDRMTAIMDLNKTADTPEDMHRLSRLNDEHNAIRREIEEIKAHYTYLRDLLIQQEYQHLEPGSGLSAVSPRSSDPMGMDVITITGPNVTRAGVYEFFSGLTVNRLLTISDAKLTPLDSIQIYREGKLVSEKTLEDIHSADPEKQLLIAGDRVKILPAS